MKKIQKRFKHARWSTFKWSEHKQQTEINQLWNDTITYPHGQHHSNLFDKRIPQLDETAPSVAHVKRRWSKMRSLFGEWRRKSEAIILWEVMLILFHWGESIRLEISFDSVVRDWIEHSLNYCSRLWHYERLNWLDLIPERHNCLNRRD